MHRRTVMTALILAAPFIFLACTITPEATADQVGKMLVAADFKFKTANTLQQMKRMQALPQRRFIRHQAGDAGLICMPMLPGANVCGEETS